MNTRIPPEKEVLVPGSQTLETGEAHARPQRRDLIVHEARVHAVKVLRARKSDNGQGGEGEFSEETPSVNPGEIGEI